MNAKTMTAGMSFPVTGFIVIDCKGMRFATEREYWKWFHSKEGQGDIYYKATLESEEEGAGIYSINLVFGRQSFRELYRVTARGVEPCGASVAAMN